MSELEQKLSELRDKLRAENQEIGIRLETSKNPLKNFGVDLPYHSWKEVKLDTPWFTLSIRGTRRLVTLVYAMSDHFHRVTAQIFTGKRKGQ